MMSSLNFTFKGVIKVVLGILIETLGLITAGSLSRNMEEYSELKSSTFWVFATLPNPTLSILT